MSSAACSSLGSTDTPVRLRCSFGSQLTTASKLLLIRCSNDRGEIMRIPVITLWSALTQNPLPRRTVATHASSFECFSIISTKPARASCVGIPAPFFTT